MERKKDREIEREREGTDSTAVVKAVSGGDGKGDGSREKGNSVQRWMDG